MYGISVISAVQMKRDAISRIRKSKDDKRDFGADDAQGSNQISADADRIYALWIDPKDDRYIKLYTAKNRYGKKSYECSLYFDAACSRIYGDTTSYDHDQIYDDQQFKEIIDLANSYNEDEENDKSNSREEYAELLSEEADTSDIEEYCDSSDGGDDSYEGDLGDLM